MTQVTATEAEAQETQYWIDTKNDVWVYADVGENGILVRLRDGKFISACFDLASTKKEFRPFRGTIVIDTRAQ